jgi:hypothetical protein
MFAAALAPATQVADSLTPLRAAVLGAIQGATEFLPIRVAVADEELFARIAHGSAAIAAAARLVEEERAVLRHEARDQGERGLGGIDTGWERRAHVARRSRAPWASS